MIETKKILVESPFDSFLMAGFECSSHRQHGRRLDLIESTQHDIYAFQDYVKVSSIGMRTVRDGIRWHLIEIAPYVYDWSSVLPMVKAAKQAGVQVIWDVMHYGTPENLDVLDSDFISRFVAFSCAFIRLLVEEGEKSPLICPINEISFFSWGLENRFFPQNHTENMPSIWDIKKLLVEATIKTCDAMWEICPSTKVFQIDPLTHIACSPERPWEQHHIPGAINGSFETLDMLCGKVCPELGGSPKYLGIIGLNHYPYSSWIHNEHPPKHPEPYSELSRPLHLLLKDVYERYERPMFISETGCEGDYRAGWMQYILNESDFAKSQNIPLLGVCIYPITDYPGWDDNRHCPCGLIGFADEKGNRSFYEPLADLLRSRS